MGNVASKGKIAGDLLPVTLRECQSEFLERERWMSRSAERGEKDEGKGRITFD